MWPAPRSTSGTAATDVAPPATSLSTAVSRSGSASSMKPQPTSRWGASFFRTSAKRQYSATPAAERLPWPTSRRDGWSRIGDPLDGVEGGGGDGAAALLSHVADGGQARLTQRRLRLGCAHEAHW